MSKFSDLIVVERAHELTLELYRLTERFPDSERFGLTSQLRRASASIGANVAEGCGRSSRRDFARFIDVAVGSAHEIEYLLRLARDLGFIGPEGARALEARCHEVQRMLAGLRRSLRSPR